MIEVSREYFGDEGYGPPTKAEFNGNLALGGMGLSASNGAEVIINGNITTVNAVWAGSEAQVIVNGDITSAYSGVEAYQPGTVVTVDGDITAGSWGVGSMHGASVTVTGGITVSGSFEAVQARYGSKATVYGSVISAGTGHGLSAREGSEIIIGGSVTSYKHYGIYAFDQDTKVTVGGNISVIEGQPAIWAEDGAVIYVAGTLTSYASCSTIVLYDGHTYAEFIVGVNAPTSTGHKYNGWYWDVYTGNTQDPQSFVYVGQSKIPAPTIISCNPANGATGVSVNLATISVTFSKAMNTSKGEASLTDDDPNGDWYDIDVTESIVWTNGDKTLTVAVPAALEYGKVYYLDLFDFESADGGNFAPEITEYNWIYIGFETEYEPALAYAVIFGAGEGGAVSATVDGQPINSGDLVTAGKTVIFTATPDEGCRVSSWFVDGFDVGSDDTYTIYGIGGAVDIQVYFMQKSYNVGVTVVDWTGGGAGADFVAAAHGTTVTVLTSPWDGWRVKAWTINGVVMNGSNSTYVITGINKDYIIEVEFEEIPDGEEEYKSVNFNVVGGNGALTAKAGGATVPAGAWVAENSSVVFTAAPAAGYRVKEWKLDGVVIAGNKSNTYTHADLTANILVTVEFEAVPSSGNNGQTPTDVTPPDGGKPKKLGGGAIAGIVIGSVAVAGIGGFAIFWFVIKKKSFGDLFGKKKA